MNWCMNCFCMKCTYSNLFFCMPAGCWNSNRLCSDFARPPNLAEGVCNFNYCMIRGLGLSVLFLTGGGANVGGCEWRHGRGGGACAFFWIAWLNSDFLTRSHWFMMKWLSRERSAPWFFFQLFMLNCILMWFTVCVSVGRSNQKNVKVNTLTPVSPMAVGISLLWDQLPPRQCQLLPRLDQFKDRWMQNGLHICRSHPLHLNGGPSTKRHRQQFENYCSFHALVMLLQHELVHDKYVHRHCMVGKNPCLEVRMASWQIEALHLGRIFVWTCMSCPKSWLWDDLPVCFWCGNLLRNIQQLFGPRQCWLKHAVLGTW